MHNPESKRLQDAPQGLFQRKVIQAATYLMDRSKAWTVIVGFLLVALIGLIGYWTGAEISFALFYLLPLTIVTWRVGGSAGALISLACAAFWCFDDIASDHIYINPATPYWNALLRLGFFLIVTYTLSALSVAIEWMRTDYLTGLANARGFTDAVELEIYRSRRSGKNYSLAYLDIDDFKIVNDTLGHNAGDALLRVVGNALGKTTRKSDVVARIGGDEFAILLPETNYDAASAAILNIQESLRRVLDSGNWRVSFSIGLASFQTPPSSVDAAIAKADELMYLAKHGAKGILVHRLINDEEVTHA